MDVRAFAYITNNIASANNTQVQFDFWILDRTTYNPVVWLKERLWREFSIIGRCTSSIKLSHFSLHQFIQQRNISGISYFHYCCKINNSKHHRHRQRKDQRKRIRESIRKIAQIKIRKTDFSIHRDAK